MPLNAAGWSTEEDEKLIELVKPHLHLYHIFDPSRNNILARVTTWQEIANKVNKPVEECKKRWRGLRDGFMRTKRLGALHKRKIPIFEKLQFLDEVNGFDEPLAFKRSEDGMEDVITMVEEQPSREDKIGTEEVITDKQEYYEITLVDEMQQQEPFLKLMPKPDDANEQDQPPKKIIKRNVGRKKSMPLPQNLQPIKILPKPVIMKEPRIVRCIETPKTLEQRSQTIDKLIEKVLKENTNEIDVFFRSMAASVKKLQPNLIPKVKMEVCNVIAKYEMQSFDKSRSIVSKEL